MYFVFSDTLCPGQQFFSHVWTFPLFLEPEEIECLTQGHNTVPIMSPKQKDPESFVRGGPTLTMVQL